MQRAGNLCLRKLGESRIHFLRRHKLRSPMLALWMKASSYRFDNISILLCQILMRMAVKKKKQHEEFLNCLWICSVVWFQVNYAAHSKTAHINLRSHLTIITCCRILHPVESRQALGIKPAPHTTQLTRGCSRRVASCRGWSSCCNCSLDGGGWFCWQFLHRFI